MNVIKHILGQNLCVRHLKIPFGKIQSGGLPFFLMIIKESRYLLLDKGVCVRNYGDGALCKPRGIWWLGRNKFIYGILFCF